MLLWGGVVRLGDKSAMRLYWTTAQRIDGVKESERYAPETLALPPLFWDDLKQVLGMLAQTRIATLTDALTGHYAADRLAPLIKQVRRLLGARHGTWTPETRPALRFAFAGALAIFGEQTVAARRCPRAP